MVTGGNINDCTMFDTVLAGVRLPARSRAARRRGRLGVIADKGYSSHASVYIGQ